MKNQLEHNIKSQYNADDYAINFIEEVYTMMRSYQGKILVGAIRKHLKQFDDRIKVVKYTTIHPGAVCVLSPDSSVEVYVGVSGQPFNHLRVEEHNDNRYSMLIQRHADMFYALENDALSEAQRELETKLEELRATLIKFHEALPMVCKTTNVGRHYLRDICAIMFPTLGRVDMLTSLMDGARTWQNQQS